MTTQPIYYLKVEEDCANQSSGILNVHTHRQRVRLIEVSPDLAALGCPTTDYDAAVAWCAQHMGMPKRAVTGYAGRTARIVTITMQP